MNSVWKSGAWHKVSSRKVTLTSAQAAAYRGISGVTIIDQH